MVDTNVFVYAYDPTDPTKQAKAQALIADRIRMGTLVVSVQVLNEFYRAATRPNRPPSLPHQQATEAVEKIVAASRVLPLTEAVTLRALEAIPRHNLPLWDALLWATAKENGIATICTEDISSAPEIEGVRYINPFAGGA